MELGVALIGSGFMGKAHALAYHAVQPVFGYLPRPRLEILCDTPIEKAEGMAKQFGFHRATADWRAAIFDPSVDVVSITTPNKLHHDMVIAAAAAGKHVWCEKPLALTFHQAKQMTAAVREAGVKSIIGYNYVHNPAVLHAKKLISDGVIGRIIHFRGVVDEDYQADPAAPWTWRCLAGEAGLGALGDLGCHLVSLAYALVGPIKSVAADMQTVYADRPKPDGSRGAVENEDLVNALVRFENGVQGVLSSSRVAWGRKNRLSFEVHGDRGMLVFDQERMNELQLFESGEPAAKQGFKTILSGPAHPPFGAFIPAPGHSLGFLDQKTIEASCLLQCIARDEKPTPDITDALEYERVIHSIAKAAKTDRLVDIAAATT